MESVIDEFEQPVPYSKLKREVWKWNKCIVSKSVFKSKIPWNFLQSRRVYVS